MDQDETTVAAVILAGGRGERLGGANKALIEFGGERLIDRALRAAASCSPVLVAVGPTGFVPDRGRPVVDLPADYAGPLAGLAAAVSALVGSEAQWLLSLAVDTPFFPADFLARAMALASRSDCVMGCFGPQDYPTNALWRLDAIRDLPDGVCAGTAPHSLRRLAASLRTMRLDYAESDAEDPFLNANTPEDLKNLALRLTSTNAP
jgi:molybdopterin-guanine dinucleotide biosynthesis protein A